MKPKSKLKNIKKVYDGYKFDSLLELGRYKQLKLLLQAGKISDLELQPKFKIIDSVTVSTNKTKKGTTKISDTYYVADFKYTENGKIVVEDTKGYETDVYKLKRHLFIMTENFDIFREFKSKKVIEYYKC